MGDYIFLIIAFAVVFVLMLIVGFIGNKITDGIENSVRSKKINNSKNIDKYSSESLAARYNNPNGARSVPQPQVVQPRFCSKCGSPIEAGSAFCSKCGAKISE